MDNSGKLEKFLHNENQLVIVLSTADYVECEWALKESKSNSALLVDWGKQFYSETAPRQTCQMSTNGMSSLNEFPTKINSA